MENYEGFAVDRRFNFEWSDGHSSYGVCYLATQYGRYLFNQNKVRLMCGYWNTGKRKKRLEDEASEWPPNISTEMQDVWDSLARELQGSANEWSLGCVIPVSCSSCHGDVFHAT